MDELRIEHLRVLDEMSVKDGKGRPMDLDDPRIPPLLQKGWGLAGAYAAEYLEMNPNPSKRDLEQMFSGFAPAPHQVKSKYGNYLEYDSYRFEGSAFRVAPAVYVVAASYGVDFMTSTFMVIARNREGHFQELWDIKTEAVPHYPQRDEIGRWLYLVRRAYYNGPLAVQKILRLSPAANGHPRFLVNADQEADGGTILAQLSIWEWDGTEAKPLLVEVYQYGLESYRFRFDGKTLRISTKEETDALLSCGGCTEPHGTWTVRITPDGVQNLGHRFRQPEIKWADELLSKINKGKDVADIAAPGVVEALKAEMKDSEDEKVQSGADASDDADFFRGMFEECRVLRRGQKGAFLVVTEEGKLRFTYVLRKGRPYFTDVEID